MTINVQRPPENSDNHFRWLLRPECGPIDPWSANWSCVDLWNDRNVMHRSFTHDVCHQFLILVCLQCWCRIGPDIFLHHGIFVGVQFFCFRHNILFKHYIISLNSWALRTKGISCTYKHKLKEIRFSRVEHAVMWPATFVKLCCFLLRKHFFWWLQ